MPARVSDPYLGYDFVVEIDGITVGGFSNVSGLQVQMETEDYREGGRNGYIHKLAGPVRYPRNLVLRRGVMDEDKLWAWQHEILQGKVTRTKVSVVLLGADGREARRWSFKNAYPVKWDGPELQALNSAVALEAIELTHEGFAEMT
jgi:phage tail-like protein